MEPEPFDQNGIIYCSKAHGAVKCEYTSDGGGTTVSFPETKSIRVMPTSINGRMNKGVLIHPDDVVVMVKKGTQCTQKEGTIECKKGKPSS